MFTADVYVWSTLTHKLKTVLEDSGKLCQKLLLLLNLHLENKMTKEMSKKEQKTCH